MQCCWYGEYESGENSILIQQSSFKCFWSNGTGELLHTEVTLGWVFLFYFIPPLYLQPCSVLDFQTTGSGHRLSVLCLTGPVLSWLTKVLHCHHPISSRHIFISLVVLENINIIFISTDRWWNGKPDVTKKYPNKHLFNGAENCLGKHIGMRTFHTLTISKQHTCQHLQRK